MTSPRTTRPASGSARPTSAIGRSATTCWRRSEPAPSSTSARPRSSPASCSRAALLQEGAQRGGHVPGAANIPWAEAVNDDGTFKGADELRELYAAKGITADKDVIAYCRIGERSSHTWFVLHELLGFDRVRNYDGSWTEYGASSACRSRRTSRSPSRRDLVLTLIRPVARGGRRSGRGSLHTSGGGRQSIAVRPDALGSARRAGRRLRVRAVARDRHGRGAPRRARRGLRPGVDRVPGRGRRGIPARDAIHAPVAPRPVLRPAADQARRTPDARRLRSAARLDGPARVRHRAALDGCLARDLLDIEPDPRNPGGGPPVRR